MTGAEGRKNVINYRNESSIIILVFAQNQDGADYPISIKAFCKPIPGLYEEMMDYGWADIEPKTIDALRKHIVGAGLSGIYYQDNWERRTQLS
jgi:hypothetical protein